MTRYANVLSASQPEQLQIAGVTLTQALGALNACQFPFNCQRQIIGMKAEWSRFTLEFNFAALSDEIQAVRPTCIVFLHFVFD